LERKVAVEGAAEGLQMGSQKGIRAVVAVEEACQGGRHRAVVVVVEAYLDGRQRMEIQVGLVDGRRVSRVGEVVVVLGELEEAFRGEQNVNL